MKIVGISGLPRSGKDSLAELFIKNGYYGVSLGDIVRSESRKRHASEPDPISLKNMTETSNFLRSTKGSDFALKQALKEYDTASRQKNYKGLVVFSVRAPVEADFILEHGGDLIWVEATDDVRYNRSISARREGEAEQSLEEMLEHEKLQEKPQEGLPPEVQMNMTYVKAHASIVFENNGSDLDEFKRRALTTFSLEA